MTEPIELAELDTVDTEYGYGEDLATSYLATATREHTHEETTRNDLADTVETDWLALLTTRPASSEFLVDEPPDEPEPSGMADHIAPARMRPTIGARLSTGLKRTVLASVLITLAAAVLLVGAYVLYASSWLSTVVPPSVVPAPVRQAAPARPAQPATSAPAQAAPGDTGSAQTSPAQGTDGEAVKPPDARAPDGQPQQLQDQGITQLKAGNYDQAIALLESAVNMNGGDAVTYYQLGLAYLGVTNREHSAEDAEMAFRTASSMQPKWAAPQQLLAESLMRRGFYQQAVDPALQAVQLDPARGEAWMTLGRAYQGAGDEARATQAFAEAAKRVPAPPSQP